MSEKPAVQDTNESAVKSDAELFYGKDESAAAPAAEPGDVQKPADDKPAPVVEAEPAAPEVPAKEPAKEPEVEKPAPEVPEKKPDDAKDKPADAEKPKDGEGKAPEVYELEVPKDSSLPADRIEALKAHAKDKGLSKDQAQELLVRESAAVDSYKQSVVQKMAQNKTQWIEQASKDKEIGGEKFAENVLHAKRALDKYGSANLKQELDSTGLGNHPELLRVFVRIGREMQDDKFIRPGTRAVQKEKSTEELFYGPEKT